MELYRRNFSCANAGHEVGMIWVNYDYYSLLLCAPIRYLEIKDSSEVVSEVHDEMLWRL